VGDLEREREDDGAVRRAAAAAAPAVATATNRSVQTYSLLLHVILITYM
jgi:hypothetical protein